MLLAIVGTAAGWLYVYGDSLSLDRLAAQEAGLREAKTNHPIIVFAAAFGVYVLVTGLSLPGAAVLTLVYGWLFGLVAGVLLVSFASTAGATTAFLMSRYLLGDWVQTRFGDRLAGFNENLRREGAYYLFTLRLIPVVPFFVINLVMGLTPIRTRTFWWVSQVGMLPGTAVYIYAGSTFPSLQAISERGAAGILSPGLVVAFVLLGLFPWVARKATSRRPKADRAA